MALQFSKSMIQPGAFKINCVGLRRDNSLADKFDKSKAVWLFENGYSMQSIIQVIKFYIRPSKLMSKLNLTMGSVCFVPMISPLGLIIEKILARQGVQIIRVLHDVQKHPGDIWPNNRIIKKVVREAKFLITLSNSVDKQVHQISPSIRTAVAEVPIFDFKSMSNSFDLPKKYILCLGRIREYKGTSLMLKALDDEQFSSVSLVVAGEGKLEFKESQNVIRIAKWLSEAEIAELVIRSEIVAFPYIEASQSGLIPFCISKNKKIVITPLPGLIDQVAGYPNSSIATAITAEALSTALIKSLADEVKVLRTPKGSIDQLFVKCILESSFFQL